MEKKHTNKSNYGIWFMVRGNRGGLCFARLLHPEPEQDAADKISDSANISDERCHLDVD